MVNSPRSYNQVGGQRKRTLHSRKRGDRDTSEIPGKNTLRRKRPIEGTVTQVDAPQEMTNTRSGPTMSVNGTRSIIVIL